MAFVSERIPKEDWSMYNSWELKDPMRKPLLEREFAHWVADRERKAYFCGLGGHGFDAPWAYALMWDGNYILVWVLDSMRRNADSSKDWCYNISHIWAPKTLSDKSDEIVELIKEALSAKFIQNPKNSHLGVAFINVATPRFVESVKEVVV